MVLMLFLKCFFCSSPLFFLQWCHESNKQSVKKMNESNTIGRMNVCNVNVKESSKSSSSYRLQEPHRKQLDVCNVYVSSNQGCGINLHFFWLN